MHYLLTSEALLKSIILIVQASGHAENICLLCLLWYAVILQYIFILSVGRIALGLLLQRFPEHKKEIYMLSLCVTSAILIILGLWTTPPGLTLSAFLFGFFMASIGAVAVEVAYILSSPDIFPTFYSFSILLSAFGWALGAPTAGRCQDISNSLARRYT